MQKATPTWIWQTNILAGITVNVPLGGENGTVTRVPTAGFKYLIFGFWFDQIVTLTIRHGVETTVMSDRLTLAGVVNTWMTPYDLPAPLRNDGMLKVATPYILLLLTNGLIGNTTVARFWAYLSN